MSVMPWKINLQPLLNIVKYYQIGKGLTTLEIKVMAEKTLNICMSSQTFFVQVKSEYKENINKASD